MSVLNPKTFNTSTHVVAHLPFIAKCFSVSVKVQKEGIHLHPDLGFWT